MMETKFCTKCSMELEISCFRHRSDYKNSYYSHCKKCLSIEGKEYKEKNKTKINKQNKEYRTENKEKILDYRLTHEEEAYVVCKAYRELHKESISQYMKNYRHSDRKKILEMDARNRENNKEKIILYRRNNKGKTNILTQKYRAKKRKLPSTLTSKQWEEIKQYFNNNCCYCGKKLPLEQEHFLALSSDGEYTINNIVPACRSCNSSKGARNFFSWYPKHKSYNSKRESKILKFLHYDGDVQQLKII